MKIVRVVSLFAVPAILVLGAWRAWSQEAQSLPFEVSGTSLMVTSDGRFVVRNSHWVGEIVVLDRKTKRVRSWHPPATNDGDAGARSLVQLGKSPLVAGLGEEFGGGPNSIAIYDLNSEKFRILARRQVSKRSLVAMPNGKTLIAAYRGGGLGFWDVRTGAIVRQWNRFGQGETAPDALSLSPNGKQLATGHYYMLYGSDHGKSGTDGGQCPQVWDIKSGRLIVTCQKVRQLPSRGDWSVIDFTSLKFSPDGRFLATGSNGNGVVVWNTKTGKTTWILAHPQNRTGRSIVYEWNGGDVAFSTDSKRIAAPGNYGTVDVYSLQTGQLLQQIKGGGPLVWRNDGLFFKGLRRPNADGLLMQIKI